jgi:hypothetical protein
MHDVFVEEGATNVKWLWAPNRSNITGSGPNDLDPTTAQYTFTSYYPGDAYADYVGIDGYTFGCDLGLWQELDQVFGPSYDVFASRTNKEIMIAETAAPEYASGWTCGGSPAPNKPGWISRAYTSWLPYRFPRATRVTWFNHIPDEAPSVDFRINSRPASTTAFNGAMQHLYDRSYFMNFYDCYSAKNWILAANPAPVNNAAISPNLSVAGSSQSLQVPIGIDATNSAFIQNLTGGPVKVTTHQIDTVNHNSTKSVVSQRTLWPNGGNSLEEVPARDYAKLSDHYYWPKYDSVGFSDWVVISNLNPFPIYYELRIAGTLLSSNIIQPNQSAAPQFPGTASGPLEVQTWVADPVNDPNNQKKLTPAFSVPSQRVLKNAVNTDFTEFNGIPASELSNHYMWTWYDNVYAANWVMIANPGPNTVYYSVKIAGVYRANNVPLPPNQLAAPYFPGVMGGPVEVTATGNVIASQRSLWGNGSSFEEVPGLPYSSLGSDYFWTWYDMSLPNVTNWVLIENPNPASVTYQIKIAGQQKLAGTIPGNGSITPTFPGTLGGPLEVSASGNVITSQRVLWKGFFNEVWGASTS